MTATLPSVSSGSIGRRIPPPSLAGFAHVKRFYNPSRQLVSAKILPGEIYVTTADELVTTILGSCVAACVWDPVARIGGMNHFMIPGDPVRDTGALGDPGKAARYGLAAMSTLVETIIRHGGHRSRLLVKVAGGGHVVDATNDIGAQNIAFARAFTAAEGLNVISEHVGGPFPRKIIFHPLTGQAQVRELRSGRNREVARRERAYAADVGRREPTRPAEVS